MYEHKFLVAFFITCLIEPLVLLSLIKKFSGKIKTGHYIAIVISASVMTLPYVWFVFPVFFKEKILYVLFSEIVVFLTEAFYYHIALQTKISYAIQMSFIANLSSFIVGKMFVLFGLNFL